MGNLVGIIGLGVIGSAIYKLFSNAEVFDPDKSLLSREALYADFVFICVPTPLEGNELSSGIVDKAVSQCGEGIIIICSTQQPGSADYLAGKYNKRIVVQPEYLGETVGHPLTNLSAQQFLILGGLNHTVNEVIELYKEVYSANIRIRKVSRYEAEVIKLSENRAAAFKVAQCQELYDACIAAGVDYETIRQAVYGDDPRFNLWWTFVYKNKRGFNSKCIPKDVYGWSHWAKSIGADATVTDALLVRNEELINS